MSLRHSWKFSYTGEQLLQPAKAKAEHHRSREGWWIKERSAADADLKEHGLLMEEFPVTGGTRLQPKYDPVKQARCEECRQKINEHKKTAEEYEMYARAFELNAGATLELDAQDILFFGL